MSTLFQISMEDNDRLLLEQEQRRQDLIDFAVRRFAPQFADKPDVKAIHLYSTNASLRKEIRALCGGKTILVEHVVTGTERRDRNEVVQEGFFLQLPAKADLVATKTALNSRVEWMAARLSAQAIVLPEATDYLLARLDKQRVLTIVGGDQVR